MKKISVSIMGEIKSYWQPGKCKVKRGKRTDVLIILCSLNYEYGLCPHRLRFFSSRLIEYWDNHCILLEGHAMYCTTHHLHTSIIMLCFLLSYLSLRGLWQHIISMSSAQRVGLGVYLTVCWVEKKYIPSLLHSF